MSGHVPSPPPLPSSKSEKRVTITEPLPSSCTSSGSSVNDGCRSTSTRGESPPAPSRVNFRRRTISGSKSEDHLITTENGRRVYTKGRPPWYDRTGKHLKHAYVIGICGGSASGKTTVARKVIERLEMPWVTVLSLDSFYKVLNEEQHELAAHHEYNFDHPDAFDFDLLSETLQRLRVGKSVEVPVYDFTTHRRDKQGKLMYGADVLIFEGILAFHRADILSQMDMKIFVDTDSDTRLARRLDRDVRERARDVAGILEQYLKHVKPAFDSFIAPEMKLADIIIPRGGENQVAIDLLVKQMKQQLTSRGYDTSTAAQQRQSLLQSNLTNHHLPDTLTIVPQTSQVKGIHTVIRNRDTTRDEFIFYSERLMRILIENAMNCMPFESVTVETSTGQRVEGRRRAADICGIAIMRAGETMERALTEVVKDCAKGRILIQTNETTMEPELYYLRLPKRVNEHRVLLLDATVATGAAAMMAIRVLLDHDVPEQNIMLLSLLMAEPGVHAIAYAFPRVRLLTTAVDATLNERFHVLPGLGNFGDRYYGTEMPLDELDSSPFDDSDGEQFES